MVGCVAGEASWNVLHLLPGVPRQCLRPSRAPVLRPAPPENFPPGLLLRCHRDWNQLERSHTGQHNGLSVCLQKKQAMTFEELKII